MGVSNPKQDVFNPEEVVFNPRCQIRASRPSTAGLATEANKRKNELDTDGHEPPVQQECVGLNCFSPV
jgi:hypothetical protein